MLDRLKSWFDGEPKDAAAREGCAKRAVCLLLVSAARADGSFGADEAREVARLVSGHFDLSPEETAELVTLAASDRSEDLFFAARILNEQFDRDRRREVLELMWRVVYSDGRLEAHEDALMHRVGRMLDIPHRDLIALKLAARGDDQGA
jgi:uncharacterized tellurite resistance protein B-like protein